MAITDATVTAILPRAKTVLRTVTTDSSLEAEIKGLIKAGYSDLEVSAGIDMDSLYEESAFNELLLRPILTYVRLNFGSPEDADRLAKSYDMQKAQLQNSSLYNLRLQDGEDNGQNE